jgi:hypothetical protein
VNLAYYIQALSKRHSHRKEEILIEVYEKRPTRILRRLIIAAMANWGCHYWLSDLKRRYGTMDEWDKRAVIIASYFLGDEGKHWRESKKQSWHPMEILVRDWYCTRFQTQKNIPI